VSQLFLINHPQARGYTTVPHHHQTPCFTSPVAPCSLACVPHQSATPHFLTQKQHLLASQLSDAQSSYSTA
jgi:hypothetical protein